MTPEAADILRRLHVALARAKSARDHGTVPTEAEEHEDEKAAEDARAYLATPKPTRH